MQIGYHSAEVVESAAKVERLCENCKNAREHVLVDQPTGLGIGLPFMKRQAWFPRCIVVVALLYGATGCSEFGPSTRNLLKVQKGMSSEDVKLLLGEPSCVRKTSSTSAFDYTVAGRKWTVQFDKYGAVLYKVEGGLDWGKSHW